MYIDEQGSNDGDPVVFLHGSMVSGWMWTEQVAALSDTHRTIAPDLPGIGRSGSEPWTSFAEVAHAVGDAIEARAPDGADIVGLSLGGIIALNLAVLRPETCRSLLVSGVPSAPVSGSLRLLSRSMAAVYSTSVGSRLIARAFGMPDDESREAFVATATATDPRAIKAIVAEVSVKPLPDGLGTISAPVLAVAGDRDTSIAREGVPLLVSMIPDARGAIVPSVGHQWNAEAPELFTDMVRRWVDHREIHPDLEEVSRSPYET